MSKTSRFVVLSLATLLVAFLASPTLTIFTLAGTSEKTNVVLSAENAAVATFAGGCFWCMEPPFDEIEGVISTTSGFIGGHVENPTYKQVVTGATGHAEAVQITYDPEIVSYSRLLEVFWRNIDPTVADRQFCDIGSQYRTAIFFHDGIQKRISEESKESLVTSGRLPAVETEIVEAGTFYPAEAYHQDFYTKNPQHYKSYRRGCGRDARLNELWGHQ